MVVLIQFKSGKWLVRFSKFSIQIIFSYKYKGKQAQSIVEVVTVVMGGRGGGGGGGGMHVVGSLEDLFLALAATLFIQAECFEQCW